MSRSARRGQDLRDLVVEAVNSGDLDLLSLAEDVVITQPLIERMIDLCQRRPQLLLTTGVLEERPVAAVWRATPRGEYEQIGHLEVSVSGSSVSVTCVTTPVPGLAADPPPEWEFVEWDERDPRGSRDLTQWEELHGFWTSPATPENRNDEGGL